MTPDQRIRAAQKLLDAASPVVTRNVLAQTPGSTTEALLTSIAHAVLAIAKQQQEFRR